MNEEDEQREFILTYGKVILNQNRLAEKLQITGSDTEIVNNIFTGKEKEYIKKIADGIILLFLCM